jgi:rod shape-determining protein MreC
VILLTDLNSRIPVTIAASSGNTGNIQAIMTGDNTAFPSLDMVSHTVTLHAGDQVISSGDGGLLPAGLPIGTVVSDNEGGWHVALLADAASSQDVEILNFSKPPESLPATAQLPMEAAGLKPQAPQAPPAPASSPVTTAAPAKSKPVVVAAPKPETPPSDASPADEVDR